MKSHNITFSLMFIFFAILVDIIRANVHVIDNECSKIISREQWHSKPPEGVDEMTSIPCFAIISHTASQECHSILDCAEKIQNIQQYHIQEKHFYDIAYNFLIGDDGNIYEGRGWDKVGSHSKNWNTKALGIAFIGNFSEKLPSTDALNALKVLLKCGVKFGKLDKDYVLLGHRQVMATLSPGRKLFDEIKEWPHFTENIPNNVR